MGTGAASQGSNTAPAIVVTAGRGHILTDRQLTDGCNVRAGERLRRCRAGRRRTKPQASHCCASTAPPTSFPARVGARWRPRPPTSRLSASPTPQSQGRRAVPVSTTSAKLNGDGLQPPAAARAFGRGAAATRRARPPVRPGYPEGFRWWRGRGHAACLQQGGACGAGRGGLRAFPRWPTPWQRPAGRGGVDAAKGSVVRVICVRR